MGKRILIFTGGEHSCDSADLSSLPPYDIVIAADGGLDLAEAIGVRANIVIGDLDSVSPDAIARARSRGAEIDEQPTEKDQTDFELALTRALQEEAVEITVMGGGGGRPDHWLSNLSLLASTARAGVRVNAEMQGWHICVVGPGLPFEEELGEDDLLSLVPMGGEAQGVTTAGLRYPLRNETLPAGTSRGVSNVGCGGAAHVEIQEGTLLVMWRREPSKRNEVIR